ncbi:glycoside hydrolase family 32 protein [Christiangramia echinicola]|uniref:Fructan beta-fructosidase n=1 Tax=Christiangramia echinicola TaxID=279359 RepID=A0A1H1M5F4_9FLAO|nr:glycoside hydrolase family 32 protein [Christiangramia echinicola]SDR81880.1 fructan beta-fructosidase [Christiangramia echinicola]
MKKIIGVICLAVCMSVSLSCKKDKKKEEDITKAEVQKDEDFRPNFHFTPKANWMNDPNGMFYLNGTYHLYFQYYPDDNVWGPMHWGHATSKDMITWEEQEIALYPDEKGYIFSGSAVVDKNNTSGFGEEGKTPVVAIYTYHDAEAAERKEDHQTQAIAYSLDEGMTWTKYEGNPVIPNPGLIDFRDPKVVWDDINDQWLMALATREKTLFYTSQDLKEWKKLSDFGENTGAHDGVWECPDIFPMQVEGSDETKWVLIQSLNPGGYNGGSGTQYFVGDFDGSTFTPEKNMEELEEKHPFWIDFGRDNYAGVTWSNIPDEDGRKLFLGWMSNWLYGEKVPTTTWRSSMTVARELKLVKDEDRYLVTSEPVEELQKYRSTNHVKKELNVNGNSIALTSEDLDLARAEIRFTISDLKDATYNFRLANSEGEEYIISYNHAQKQFSMNRSHAGQTGFSDKFATENATAPRISNSDSLNAIIILDKTSIEMYFDNGKTVITEIFFPNYPWDEFSFAGLEEFTVSEFQAYELEFPGKEAKQQQEAEKENM